MAMYSNAQEVARNRTDEPAHEASPHTERSDAIDVVYTWVDGQDPQWQRSYGNYVGGDHSKILVGQHVSNVEDQRCFPDSTLVVEKRNNRNTHDDFLTIAST